jgi:hypothetical protein
MKLNASRQIGVALLWLTLTTLTLWTFGALWFDFPFAALRKTAAVVYAAGAIAMVIRIKNRWLVRACLASRIRRCSDVVVDTAAIERSRVPARCGADSVGGNRRRSRDVAQRAQLRVSDGD